MSRAFNRTVSKFKFIISPTTISRIPIKYKKMISLMFHVEVSQQSPLTSRFAAIMPSIAGNELEQYFLPGWGISRNILFSHIHFFLGPHASVRPYSYQGREGYLVITPGPPLTEVRTSRRANSTRRHSLESKSNP